MAASGSLTPPHMTLQRQGNAPSSLQGSRTNLHAPEKPASFGDAGALGVARARDRVRGRDRQSLAQDLGAVQGLEGGARAVGGRKAHDAVALVRAQLHLRKAGSAADATSAESLGEGIDHAMLMTPHATLPGTAPAASNMLRTKAERASRPIAPLQMPSIACKTA